MSKNVSITEGRRGRRFGNVKKLKTALQGGGSCAWVPEDDVQLEPLFATENGTFRPEEYGFSEASIHVVDGNIGMLNANDNLSYIPDGDLDGYGKVTVNVPEDKQNTFSDAIQVSICNDPNLPYLFVVFSRYTTSYGAGFIQHVVQSKYPPFVCDSTRGNPAVFTFAKGHDCFRITTNFYLTDSNPGDVPICYLKNLSMLTRFEYTAGVNLFGWLIKSVVENYKDVDLLLGSKSIYEYPTVADETTVDTIVIEKFGGYTGVFLNSVPKVNVLVQNSSWRNPDGTSTGQHDLSGVRVVTRMKAYASAYQHSTMLTDFDYRIIKGMSFQSGSDWLDWCKAH